MVMDFNLARSRSHPGEPPRRNKGGRHYAEWYRNYLASEEWELIRQSVMERANGFCEGCRARVATEIHHLTYEHVGFEFLWELVAICSPCHRRLHKG
jgi:5-methylcytosine-specific restriction endonuclease McrA